LADNLGLQHFIQEYQHGYIRRRIEARRINKLLLIIVNAGNKPRETIEQAASSPGAFSVGYKTAITGIDNHSATMVDMVRLMLSSSSELRKAYELCQGAMTQTCPDAMLPAELLPAPVDSAIVYLRLEDIPSLEERRVCLDLPTRLCLPRYNVELLIRVGREMTLNSLELSGMLSRMDTEAVPDSSTTPGETELIESVGSAPAPSPSSDP